MENTEKSLAQIGYEASISLDGFSHARQWHMASPSTLRQAMAFAAAVEAAVLARQPSPAMAGELSDDLLAAIRAARNALGCLVSTPASTMPRSWLKALGNSNMADAECLDDAYTQLTSALEFAASRPVSPITQTPQLTEEDKEELLQRADKFFSRSDLSFRQSHEHVVEMLFTEIPKRLSILATPRYHVTAEKPPTEKDGNADGMLLAFGSQFQQADRWSDCIWDFVVANPNRCPFWMPMPPAPVSPVTAEDAAFDSALQSHDLSALCEVQPNNRTILRALFDAGRAFER